MRKPIITQLYEVFDAAQKNDKLFAFCYSIPKDISMSMPIWFENCLMREADGTIVERKYVTVNAIRVVDIRPVCVVIETPNFVYICMKPGEQNFDQKALKKVLNMGRSTKKVSCNIDYVFFTNATVEGKAVYFHNALEGVSDYLLFDDMYDFGNALMLVNVEKPNRTDADFKIKLMINQYCTFYPMLG